MSQPITIGITLGDANGIGPEIALKAARRRWPAPVRLVLIGHPDALPGIRLPFWNPEEGLPPQAKCSIWNPDPAVRFKPMPGKVRADAARAAHTWIVHAACAAMAGHLDAMVTAPISKEGFQKAGLHVPGHTELLAACTGTDRYDMMLLAGDFRVVLATRHLPLREVADALSVRGIAQTIQVTHEALGWLGSAGRRIAVCGLNPHAGDGGALGQEERTIITPALKRAARAGVQATGPVPADTVFYQVRQKAYDAVVAMYHDQGLAPFKMLAFEKGVNVTLGLPIVRTSPDHGTAYDLAGLNKANPSSMVEAIRLAIQLAGRPNPWRRA